MSNGTLIELENPYHNEDVKVTEEYQTVKQQVENIKNGNIDFMTLTRKNGTLITISPKNWAKIEFTELTEGADE